MATTVHAQLRVPSASGGHGSGDPVASGKRSGIPIERFQQEGGDQLGGDPAARDGGVLVRNMPEREELLQPLEDVLDSPATSAEFEHPGRVEGVAGEGGEDQDEVPASHNAACTGRPCNGDANPQVTPANAPRSSSA